MSDSRPYASLSLCVYLVYYIDTFQCEMGRRMLDAERCRLRDSAHAIDRSGGRRSLWARTDDDDDDDDDVIVNCHQLGNKSVDCLCRCQRRTPVAAAAAAPFEIKAILWLFGIPPPALAFIFLCVILFSLSLSHFVIPSFGGYPIVIVLTGYGTQLCVCVYVDLHSNCRSRPYLFFFKTPRWAATSGACAPPVITLLRREGMTFFSLFIYLFWIL